jgi:hypothetical protein
MGRAQQSKAIIRASTHYLVICADKIRKRRRFISDGAVLFEAAGMGAAFAGPDTMAADFAVAGSSERIRV